MFSHTASAAIISILPANQTVNEGESVSVDIVVSDLGDFIAPSLGAFFMEVLFDDTILSLDSVTYGTYLGDTDPFFLETDIVTTIGADFVEMDEFSFLFDFELDALQPDSFTLATLEFNTAGLGTSGITFGFTDFSDGVGNILIPNLFDSAVEVIQAPVTVAEPDTIALLVIGIFGLATKRRRALVKY